MFDPHLNSLAKRCGLPPRELSRYVELELIPLPTGDVTDATLRRVRRIRRLRRDLGIDLEIVAIIVHLLDRIQELEATRPSAAQLTGRVVRHDK